MKSIHAGASDDRIVRKSAPGKGTQEVRRTKIFGCVPGFKPWLPTWQVSALSITLCPSGYIDILENISRSYNNTNHGNTTNNSDNNHREYGREPNPIN